MSYAPLRAYSRQEWLRAHLASHRVFLPLIEKFSLTLLIPTEIDEKRGLSYTPLKRGHTEPYVVGGEGCSHSVFRNGSQDAVHFNLFPPN